MEMEVVLFLAVIVFLGYMGVRYLRNEATVSGSRTEVDKVDFPELKERLDEIDRRLTDVQDVMIALSEKFDRWEAEKAKIQGR